MRFLPLILAAGLSVGSVARGEAQVPSKTASEDQAVKAARRTVFVNATVVSGSDVLRGVTKVRVWIEKVPPALSGVISSEEISTAVELRCRSLSLKVVDDNGLEPALYVSFGSVQIPNMGVAYDISVQLQESAILMRDMKTGTLATVWESGSSCFAGSSRLSGTEVKNHVLSLVDKFLNEWMKANGK